MLGNDLYFVIILNEKMASIVSNEKDSLLLKIERQIFTHQEDFDDRFHKNEPPVRKIGMC